MRPKDLAGCLVQADDALPSGGLVAEVPAGLHIGRGVSVDHAIHQEDPPTGDGRSRKSRPDRRSPPHRQPLGPGIAPGCPSRAKHRRERPAPLRPIVGAKRQGRGQQQHKRQGSRSRCDSRIHRLSLLASSCLVRPFVRLWPPPPLGNARLPGGSTVGWSREHVDPYGAKDGVAVAPQQCVVDDRNVGRNRGDRLVWARPTGEKRIAPWYGGDSRSTSTVPPTWLMPSFARISSSWRSLHACSSWVLLNAK